MLNRHPKAIASALIMCCLLLAALGAARGQDTPKPANPTPASKSSNAADRTVSAPKTAPQATEMASSPKPAETPKPHFKVQLLLVRTDWSQGKDMADLDGTLKEVLKDIALPEPLRANLAKAAPAALFPNQFAVTYEPGEFAAALAWMRAHELVRVAEVELLPVHEDYLTGGDGYQRFFVGDRLMPVPADARGSVPPYVTQEKGWEWCLHSTSHDQEESGENAKRLIDVDIQRRAQKREQRSVRGQAAVSSVDTTYESKPIRVTFPADQILAMSGYTPDTAAPNDWWNSFTSRQEWQPIVTLSPANLQASEVEEPRLTSPTSIVEVSRPQDFRFPARLDQGFKREDESSEEIGDDNASKQVAVFHLKHADLSQVIRALAAVTSAVRAQVDDLGGALTVMGLKDDLAVARDLIEALDQPAAPDQRQIKIFHLVHARANQMAAILRQLFPEITMSGDERTNSLIAQGEQGRLEAAEAVIQKLDETPSEKQEPPLDEASRRRILETASGEFASAEAEIQSIVESIAGEADKKEAEQLRARLSALVAEAFDLRQKLQRAELALLKERVGIIESRLGQRNSLRDEIIKRRVESLLAGGPPVGETAGVATNRPPAAGAAAEQLAANVRPDDDKDGSKPIAWGSDEDIRSRTREQRLATWQKAYAEQRARNPWPPQLSPLFHGAVKGTLEDEAMMAIPLLEEYHKYVKQHAPQLDMIIDRRRPKQLPKLAPGAEPQGNMTQGPAAKTDQPEMEGTVEWNDVDYARIQAGFYWITRPSTLQVRLAQEDLWAYESILRTIAKLNEDAKSGESPVVKRIETLALGQPAAEAIASTRPKSPSEAPSKKADGQAASGTPIPTKATEKQVAERLLTGRYVDSTGTALAADERPLPEFNLLPVQLVVDIQEKALPDLLTQLANCAMPVEAIRVKAEPAAGHEDSAGTRHEIAHVRVHLLGMIRIINPPDESKLRDTLVRMQFHNQPWADVLQWLAEVSDAELQIADAMPEGTFNYSSNEPMGVDEATRLITKALWSRGCLLWKDSFRSSPLAAPTCHILVEYMEGERLRRRAAQLQEDVAKWKRALEEEDANRDEGYAATARTRLEAAERGLADLRADVTEQLSNSIANLQQTEPAMQAARQESEDLQKLLAKGYVTRKEVDTAGENLKQLDLQCELCRNQVEALRKAADATGLSPAEIKKAEAAAEDIARQFREEPSGVPHEDALQGAAPQVAEPSSGTPSGPRPTPRLRTPEEFQRAASDARVSIERLQNRMHTKDEYEGIERDLASAQQRLTMIQAEFATQLRLLESEVRKAELEYGVAQSAWRTVDDTVREVPDAYSKNEVDKYRATSEVAKAQLEQAKALLELYLKAGENPELKGSDSAPVGKGAKEPPATSEGTSLLSQGTVAAAATPAPRLALRSPDEFLRVANEARDRVKSLQNSIEEARSRRAEVKKEDLPNLESAMRDMEADLTSAQQRLELVQAEYAAQIRLLENELASAKSRLSFAQQAVYRDARTGAERTKMAQDREQAKSQCEQAQILLDLYRKAGEKADLNPNDANPLKDSSKSNDAPTDAAPLPKAQTAPNGANDGKTESPR